MHVKRALSVAAAGSAIVAAATFPAVAGTSAPAKTKQFPSSVSPSKGVTPGTVLHVKGRHAKKNTDYACILIVLHGSNYGYNLGSYKTVTSNAHGKVKCDQTFQPYTVSDTKGKTRHCPTTKKERKHGFRCAVAISTTDKTSATVAYFKAKH